MTVMNQTELKITKDMTVGDMVSRYPRTVNVMLSNGLHCIGCAANPYETVENGALGHGMTQEQVDQLIEELNRVANEPERAKDTIYFTERAINKIKELGSSENKTDWGLKVQAKSVGCDAWDYYLDFAKTKAADEEEKILGGITMYITDESWRNLLGAEIDYLVTPDGEGFKIENPNKGNCKCGKC